jgi:hypothetical protein
LIVLIEIAVIAVILAPRAVARRVRMVLERTFAHPLRPPRHEAG